MKKTFIYLDWFGVQDRNRYEQKGECFAAANAVCVNTRSGETITIDGFAREQAAKRPKPSLILKR